MTPQPVWKRILKALELGAMTVAELARCLCLSIQTVYRAAQGLRLSGEIHSCWVRLKSRHRSSLRYSL